MAQYHFLNLKSKNWVFTKAAANATISIYILLRGCGAYAEYVQEVESMRRQFELIVFGATMFAAGCAKHGGDMLVIEKGETAATDYVNCINKINARLSQKNEKTKELEDRLRRAGLISEDGMVHIYPLEGICATYLKNVCILFNTEVLSVSSCSGGFEVKVYNPINGFMSLAAKKVIDTTANGCFENQEFYDRKLLCAEVQGSPSGAAAEIVKGRYDDEYACCIEVDRDCDYHGAVKRIFEKWNDICKTEKLKMTAVAPRFLYSYSNPFRREIECGFSFVPSVSFGDIGYAFEEGFNEAELHK